MTITVRPLTGAIGAVLEGVDAATLDDGDTKMIESALHEHLVVFLRDQDLPPEQYKAFGARFGELQVQPHFADLGGSTPEVHLIDVAAGPATGRYSDSWHTDVTDQACPPLGSILRPQLLPATGGDTLWASMFAAYDALSPTMRAFCDGLTAEHFGSADRGGPVRHPVVRRHPVTGRKSLFVNRVFTKSIVGLSPDESGALLRLLFDHSESVDFQVRWSWRLGDIAFWDNRATIHYAVHDYTERRVMERMTLKGDRPVR